MRFAFVGAVEGSAVALEALIASDLSPALLVTLPQHASARHSDYVDLATPARDSKIPLHFTRNINDEQTMAALRAADLDLVLVLGWSQICGPAFRGVARAGCLGFHPAPLPRFRGRAVIPWTILRGETMSGSTLFWLDEGVDSGPIVAQGVFAVSPEETARSLYDKHLSQIRQLVPSTLKRIAAGERLGVAQDKALASFCARRVAEDGLIAWGESADAVLRLIRAVGEPYPGAFTHVGTDRLVIDAARPFRDSDRHIALPGQVVAHTEAGFAVMCGNERGIEVTAWHGDGIGLPKLHCKLR
ncbi:methionyl-tRNA formyltransferase [Jiella sp. MQZ9-1]|uniref:Methionyl-tRNA formyltransferase n=1 Tax=Jiella flava TaxID=2816857 RepID=A0A939G0Y1_9HYPH|nr:formyltransferase family protein [Jiella flava]MBO0663029.1 methionyl-tRNA formyltransferase [Jiella flava]MCD2471448.1 methionyl-tRNA formyltransferase [Jiella flava]